MQIFLDPEAIKIMQNQLLQTLESWGPTFTISVEIKITSFQKQEEGHWGEILRLTSRPGDCCLNGQRVPVVFLSRTYRSWSLSNQINVVLEPYSRSFYITTTIGSNADKKFHIDGLEENIWYKMVLSQKKIGVWTWHYWHWTSLSSNQFQFLLNLFLGITLFSSTSKWRSQSKWTKPQSPNIWRCPSICIC